MLKLKIGYVITGIVTGLLLLLTFFSQLPDGKLHVIFCNVGQGDAAYIRFPDGRDMVIDGGPGGTTPKVLQCLGTYMPFFDRQIDIVILTHPQEDHLGGLQEILKRYEVKNFLHSDVANTTEGFQQLQKSIAEKHIPDRIVATGEVITIGHSRVGVIWPRPSVDVAKNAHNSHVLGAANVNDASVVLKLSYGNFDVLFPGDADSHVDPELIKERLDYSDGLEVLKVPHHGSKTGMTDGFIQWIGKVKLAVISVGKNSYGHPASETIARLQSIGATILRTDTAGNIEIISDGKKWEVKKQK